MTSVSNPAIWLVGYIPDIPTPFDEHGAVDLTAFARLCERQIDAGVGAILVSETGGEASTLTPAEQEVIIRTAVKVAQGRVRVIAGAGSNSTSQAIELAQRAEAAGADAVLSVVPYYNKPMQAGIQAHFRRSRSPPRYRSSCTTFHPGPCASCPMTRYRGSPARDTSSD
jgi:4-hydroxy-tetrahydrodipicolinate synthase